MAGIEPKNAARAPIQFFRSAAMPCPYLPGRTERKLFARLRGPEAGEMNALLTRAGFRRSHDILYRPVCSGCNACTPLRIRAEEFAPSRNLRRVAQRNRDLSAEWRPARATGEQYRLFVQYQYARHFEGEMARMDGNDYRHMVEEGAAATRILEFRDAESRLVGAMLVDCFADGYSAVYSFFAPDQPRRSLGTHMVLALVEAARASNLPYVYLGYWVEGCRKMTYKSRFAPLEALGTEGWKPFTPKD
jgi:arginine-tRNA-protein transferase